MVKIAVLGAGINGISCAVKIREKFKNIEVVVIAKEFTPNTTGDGSGGLWYPYLCGHTPEHLLAKWGGETYKFLHELWLEGGHNISLMSMYALHRENKGAHAHTLPNWAGTVFGYHELETRQLEFLSRLYSTKYVAGHTFTTFVVQPPMILALLHHRFRQAGGRVLQANIKSLLDPALEEFQVVVNCTGLGARDIVPDYRVFPIRGQIFKVIAPWMNSTLIDEDSGHYIIPNADTCVLGGTHQEHDFNTALDDGDTEFILNGCKAILPGLKHAKIEQSWVGLRPGRHEVRLEAEQREGTLYVHNYGHGGSGLTLFWGCATEVLNILEPHLNKTNRNIKSKL